MLFSVINYIFSSKIGLVLALYAFTLPNCKTNVRNEKKTMVEALGLDAFHLFREKQLSIFFIFSMLLGVSLQITNGFANPFIASFEADPRFVHTFGVQHSNILISFSQVSETVCISCLFLFS